MPSTATRTDEAQEMFWEFIEKAGKTHLKVRVADVFGEPKTITITPGNLAEFFAEQVTNGGSGIRTLAGLHGDWRPISELADIALDWFRRVNVEGMRKAARKFGLEPCF